MASRRMKTFTKRTGLRSGKLETVQDDPAWVTDEEDAGGSTAHPLKQPRPGEASAQEMLAMMQSFMEGQRRREDRFLAELRGLRDSFPVPDCTRSPSEGTETSMRLDLPTPAPRRHRSSAEPQRPSLGSERVLSRPES
ncbi:unnamed protein product [Knipowitschia caucasica]